MSFVRMTAKRRQWRVRTGLLSIERGCVRVAETFLRVEGNMDALAMVREYQARGVEEPMYVRTCLAGTWESVPRRHTEVKS